ncbi:phosphoribosylformylglycinamidine cyclo-ligase [Myxococcota bacterium]
MAEKPPETALTYRGAGVDIDAGEEVVSRIRRLVESTHRAGVIGDLGGFSGLFTVPDGLVEPVLVSGTDGVGTKLKIAFATSVHDTVGIDLVAMCVNDIITTGATPLFFLDYFATGKLEPRIAETVITGIVKGCRLAGCALLGGETAELPGFYAPGEYDLAGFAVGVVDRSEIITGQDVVPGDRVVGIASSGVHSNGFSLARKSLLEVQGLELSDCPDPLGASVGEALLEPTRIYSRVVTRLCSAVPVRAIAHVTGGGLVDNPPRVLPDGLGVRIHRDRWPVPAIFDLIARPGVAEPEMWRTFNMGIGLVVIVPAEHVDEALAVAEAVGERGWEIGEVIDGPDGAPRVLFDP